LFRKLFVEEAKGAYEAWHVSWFHWHDVCPVRSFICCR